MNWFTTFQIPKAGRQIHHGHKILSIGSCFAQAIGDQLTQSKFNTLVNPFGTLFNPVSISKALTSSINQDPTNPALISEREGQFFHYYYHSDLWGESQADLIEKIQNLQKLVRDFLQSTDVLILTFGTARVYSLQDSTQVLANCHKQPQSFFEKRLLTLDEMKAATRNLTSLIQSINPEISLIFTVSPVRHIKDRIPENQLSKSLLRVLCAELETEFSAVSYFPSYEIMMDELRDYRFYKADRIHPTQEAEEYIWKKWCETHLSTEAQNTVAAIDKINTELGHRPMNPKSESQRKFLLNLMQKLERFEPKFDFSEEIRMVNQQLTQLNQEQN